MIVIICRCSLWCSLGVDRAELKKVWSASVATPKQRSLKKHEFFIACRLVALVQQGRGVSRAELNSIAAVAAPKFNLPGVPPVPPNDAVSGAAPAGRAQAQAPGGAGGNSPWIINPDDREKYNRYVLLVFLRRNLLAFPAMQCAL